MESLTEAYGENRGDKRVLRQIPFYVLSDEPDEVLRARWVKYDGRKCLETCDGREHVNRVTGEVRPCSASHAGESKWKLHGDLACVIAHGSARFGGVYRFRTTSQISLSQLYGGLLEIKALTGGILVGIPLRLVVRPVEVSPQGKATTVYVVHLEIHATDLREVQRDALAAATYRAQHYSQIRAVQQEYAALLAPPGDESGDEIEALVEEYHPEQIEPAGPDPLAALRGDEPPALPEGEREPGEDG